jgi:hypothetical protein
VKNAIPIALDFWQDPQSDIILIYGESECSVYFRCWSDAGVPADYIGRLAFADAAAVRSFPREFVPYQTAQHSAPIREKTHFVVVGHDIYHEVLATSFSSTKISKAEVNDPRLLKLIAAE